MARSYRPIDLSKLRTYSVQQRTHRSRVAANQDLPAEGASASELVDSLPDYLGAAAFKNVVAAVAAAVSADRPVVVAFGAHVIKVGCGPILVDLIDRGVIRAIVCNGACAIHDVELATNGETSEEVADTIRDGSFGMVKETIDFFDQATWLAQKESIGFGSAVGRLLADRDVPYARQSVFVAAHKAGIPATIHVALGTDTVHVSPNADGAAWGAATLHDFRLVCDIVSDLGARKGEDVGGVWLNIGSAVVLPEVFLKAVSVARNLGANLDAMTTANFDMIRHYRPGQNVVSRPVTAGRGFEIVGHHEILLPLFRQAVIERLHTRTDS